MKRSQFFASIAGLFAARCSGLGLSTKPPPIRDIEQQTGFRLVVQTEDDLRRSCREMREKIAADVLNRAFKRRD